jgi:hypothetical protein
MSNYNYLINHQLSNKSKYQIKIIIFYNTYKIKSEIIENIY